MSLRDKVGKIFSIAIKNEENISKTINYLVRYGYLDDKVDNTIDMIIKGVHLFQDIAGVPTNGILDAKTLKVMEWPRCCIKDNITEAATSLPKWGKNHLAYYFSGYDNDVSKEEWAESFAVACSYHAAVCNLTFSEVKNANDADLIFGVGQGSRDDFDGASGTLAWQQLPYNSNFLGQLQGKYDLAESWIPYGRTGRGIYLVNVACHEIGHALGLSHSKVKNALLAPFYSPSIDRPQADDIARLVARYGKPVNIPTPNPVPTIPLPPEISDYIIRIKGSISVDGYRLQKIG